ncbi:MAG: histidinol-phosphate transaminase [Candidatus Nezhaarchaeota archaeon]|nr:histidinol-phosphate transaminase [Candidatus Nezhaarchaeota archaeon]
MNLGLGKPSYAEAAGLLIEAVLKPRAEMKLAERLARPWLAQVRPYEAYEPPSGVLELDSNENFVVSEEWARSILARAASEVDPRKYPPPYGREAAEAISRRLGVDAGEVAVSSGSDELIDLLFKVFTQPGDEVVIVEPTFEVYGLAARVAGVKVRAVLLREDFSLDARRVVEAAGAAKLVFVCSPNNPTGRHYGLEEVREVAEGSPGLVVVDEAYVDFASHDALELALSLENVVVLRSFSKVAGMAGLRVGYAVSRREVVDLLRRAELPFKVSSVAQRAVSYVIEEWGAVERFIEEVRAQREWLFAQLSSIPGLRPYPSQANFVLARVAKEGLSSEGVCSALLARGILVRDRGRLPLLENCLRITVGPREANRRVVEALREVVGAA